MTLPTPPVADPIVPLFTTSEENAIDSRWLQFLKETDVVVDPGVTINAANATTTPPTPVIYSCSSKHFWGATFTSKNNPSAFQDPQAPAVLGSVNNGLLMGFDSFPPSTKVGLGGALDKFGVESEKLNGIVGQIFNVVLNGAFLDPDTSQSRNGIWLIPGSSLQVRICSASLIVWLFTACRLLHRYPSSWPKTLSDHLGA